MKYGILQILQDHPVLNLNLIYMLEFIFYNYLMRNDL